MIEDFGGTVESTAEGYTVQARAAYVARTYVIEPDASSASYPFALAAVTAARSPYPA
jgi:3-phosphoshikimate 1-carboxyvinyltransferase